jgi:hypothetical protein
MSLNYSGINWIVRSYIMLHIKGGTKTSILINKRFLDIHCWQRRLISAEAQEIHASLNCFFRRFFCTLFTQKANPWPRAEMPKRRVEM